MAYYSPVQVAKVSETGLGADGLSIKAANELMPAIGEIPPALDGLLKVPPPLVGDFVLILTADSKNLYRWYIPIRAPFPTIAQDGANIQLESEGKIQMQATDLIEIGQESLEAAVKGETLKQQMTDILNEVVIHTHISAAPGVPTAPPIDAAVFTAFISLLTQYLSLKVKIQ